MASCVRFRSGRRRWREQLGMLLAILSPAFASLGLSLGGERRLARILNRGDQTSMYAFPIERDAPIRHPYLGTEWAFKRSTPPARPPSARRASGGVLVADRFTVRTVYSGHTTFLGSEQSSPSKSTGDARRETQ